jgi:hypothetical protein
MDKAGEEVGGGASVREVELVNPGNATQFKNM